MNMEGEENMKESIWKYKKFPFVYTFYICFIFDKFLHI